MVACVQRTHSCSLAVGILFLPNCNTIDGEIIDINVVESIVAVFVLFLCLSISFDDLFTIVFNRQRDHQVINGWYYESELFFSTEALTGIIFRIPLVARFFSLLFSFPFILSLEFQNTLHGLNKIGTKLFLIGKSFKPAKNVNNNKNEKNNERLTETQSLNWDCIFVIVLHRHQQIRVYGEKA